MYFTLKFSEYVPVCLVMKTVVIKTKVIYGKQNPQNNSKKARGRRTEKQTLWHKEQGLIVNEEALKHAWPQCIRHTTSTWQKTVLV